MKKIYLVLILLLGITGLAKSQNDPNAKKVLDGVSLKLKTLKGVTANFSYTTKDRNKSLKGSVKGKISIKGQKYYIKQASTEIFCNGLKVWNFNGEDEVTVADVESDDNKTLSPQKLLSNFYDKDFTFVNKNSYLFEIFSFICRYHHYFMVTAHTGNKLVSKIFIVEIG